VSRNLLLLSSAGSDKLFGHCEDAVREHVGSRKVLFIPWAAEADHYNRDAAMVRARFGELGIETFSIHEMPKEEDKALAQAEAIFIGEGNAFRLLWWLQQLGWGKIASRVQNGLPYIGAGAGALVACPTIGTSTDTPISQSQVLSAMSLVPFQISVHCPKGAHLCGHNSEANRERTQQYANLNQVEVLELWSGSWFQVNGDSCQLDGSGCPAATSFGPNWSIMSMYGLRTLNRLLHPQPVPAPS
jgi:peptidase E